MIFGNLEIIRVGLPLKEILSHFSLLIFPFSGILLDFLWRFNVLDFLFIIHSKEEKKSGSNDVDQILLEDQNANFSCSDRLVDDKWSFCRR